MQLSLEVVDVALGSN
jgi:hypothetical protein